MSGRKRHARHDPSDPMHWNKEQYIHHLKEMGISVKSTWRLDMIRQLYFENYKNTPQSEGEVPQDTININDNTSTEPSKEQNEMETQVQQTNQNSGATHTEELLKETTCALKTATEALSSMSSMVAGILQNKGATGSTPNQKSNFDLSTAFQATYRTATPLNPSNVEQTFCRQVDTSKGIVYSEDLPKLDYVSPTLRKQILEGKDINLALLLYPKNEVPQTRTTFSEGLTVELSAPKDTRIEQCLTLDEFNKAFRKYRNIICKVYPQRRDELDQYEADINDIATNYGPKFYRYHKMFSAKAANAIIEHNIAINWGKVDDRLLHLVMHGTQSRECELCGDYDHTTKFCEKQGSKEIPLQKAPQSMANIRSVGEKNKDRYGRNIIQVEGHDLCNNFNYGTCKWKDCKFSHACLKCKGKGHGFKTCEKTNFSKQNQNKTSGVQKAADR